MLAWIQLKILFVSIFIRIYSIESKSINGSRFENFTKKQLTGITESALINVTRSKNSTRNQLTGIQGSESINGPQSKNFTEDQLMNIRGSESSINGAGSENSTKNQLVDIEEPESINITEKQTITTPKVLCRSLTPSISCFNLVPLKLFHSPVKKSSKTKFDQLLQFHAFDRTFNVKLYQLITGHDVMPPSVKISVRSNGTTKSRDVTNMGIQLFEGYLMSEPGFSYVHGALHRDEYKMTIRTEAFDIYVEPPSEYAHLRRLHDTADTENHVIVYRNTDIVLPTLSENSTCYKIPGPGNRSARSQITTTAFNRSVRALRRWKLGKQKRELALMPLQICELFVLVDHTFYQNVAGGSAERAVLDVADSVASADFTFRMTDLDSDSVADNCGFVVKEIHIFETAEDPGYLFGRTDMNYDQILEAMSRYDLDKFCLGIGFFNRNFADGVIGIAWLGSPHDRLSPGICSKRTLNFDENQQKYELFNFNSLVVTNKNEGSEIPRAMFTHALAHELGHSFGAEHDDVFDYPSCRPDKMNNWEGTYVMYSKAQTSHDKPNNWKFSDCSTARIGPMIQNHGSCMLQMEVRQVCGNMIVETGEECDCGSVHSCKVFDKCCTAAPPDPSRDGGCTYDQQLGAVCSPKADLCCTADCNIISGNSKFVCRSETDCYHASICDGVSQICPMPERKPNGTLCNKGRGTCRSGECDTSYCKQHDLIDCQCTEPYTALCKVCCGCQITSDQVVCLPADWLALESGAEVQFQHPGSPCDNNAGTCNLNNLCMVSKNQLDDM